MDHVQEMIDERKDELPFEDVSELLSDAQKMHHDHPDTFEAPSAFELGCIKPEAAEGRRGLGEEGRSIANVTPVNPPTTMIEYACPKRASRIDAVAI